MVDYKRLGELTELRFYLKSFELGLIVSKPFGDNAKYDFIVDNGKRLFKIQVKSTTGIDSFNRQNRYRINCSFGASDKKIYQPEDIDYVVCYIVPEDTWYIVPISETRGCKTLGFYPHRTIHSTNNIVDGKYEKFREAWAQFY